MIDTHTHLYMPEYADGLDGIAGQVAAVDRALALGVEMMILPNVDRSSIEPMKALHSERCDSTAICIGLHPTEVKDNWREEVDEMLYNLRSAKGYTAVGEIGLDLYWDKQYENEQMQAFEVQLAAAEELGFPVIIHCREALPQTLEVLQGRKSVEAVFHSFGGTDDDVDMVRRCGDYYFGINGIVTFKNSKLRYTLPHIGLDRILTETDAPFLAPTPHRGRRNESAYLPLIVDSISDALSLTPNEVDIATTVNAKKLFKL